MIHLGSPIGRNRDTNNVCMGCGRRGGSIIAVAGVMRDRTVGMCEECVRRLRELGTAGATEYVERTSGVFMPREFDALPLSRDRFEPFGVVPARAIGGLPDWDSGFAALICGWRIMHITDALRYREAMLFKVGSPIASKLLRLRSWHAIKELLDTTFHPVLPWRGAHSAHCKPYASDRMTCVVAVGKLSAGVFDAECHVEEVWSNLFDNFSSLCVDGDEMCTGFTGSSGSVGLRRVSGREVRFSSARDSLRAIYSSASQGGIFIGTPIASTLLRTAYFVGRGVIRSTLLANWGFVIRMGGGGVRNVGVFRMPPPRTSLMNEVGDNTHNSPLRLRGGSYGDSHVILPYTTPQELSCVLGYGSVNTMRKLYLRQYFSEEQVGEFADAFGYGDVRGIGTIGYPSQFNRPLATLVRERDIPTLGGVSLDSIHPVINQLPLLLYYVALMQNAQHAGCGLLPESSVSRNAASKHTMLRLLMGNDGALRGESSAPLARAIANGAIPTACLETLGATIGGKPPYSRMPFSIVVHAGREVIGIGRNLKFRTRPETGDATLLAEYALTHSNAIRITVDTDLDAIRALRNTGEMPPPVMAVTETDLLPLHMAFRGDSPSARANLPTLHAIEMSRTLGRTPMARLARAGALNIDSLFILPPTQLPCDTIGSIPAIKAWCGCKGVMAYRTRVASSCWLGAILTSQLSGGSADVAFPSPSVLTHVRVSPNQCSLTKMRWSEDSVFWNTSGHDGGRNICLGFPSNRPHIVEPGNPSGAEILSGTMGVRLWWMFDYIHNITGTEIESFQSSHDAGRELYEWGDYYSCRSGAIHAPQFGYGGDSAVGYALYPLSNILSSSSRRTAMHSRL